MTLEVVASGQFKLNGSVNFVTSPAIEKQGCRLLLESGVDGWEIDLGGISQADSSALSVFLSWMRLAQENRKSVCFTGMPDKLQALAQVCGIQPLLDRVS